MKVKHSKLVALFMVIGLGFIASFIIPNLLNLMQLVEYHKDNWEPWQVQSTRVLIVAVWALICIAFIIGGLQSFFLYYRGEYFI